MMLLRRSLIFLVLICLGCSAQSAPPDTVKAVERQVRGFYNIPPEVKIIVGAPKPSDFPNYAPGSWGPEAADELLRRDDRHWRSTAQ